MEHNLSKGNEFFLQVNSHANQIIFHMKGCARDRIKTEVKISSLITVSVIGLTVGLTGDSSNGEEKI